jgi:hypothetical protein
MFFWTCSTVFSAGAACVADVVRGLLDAACLGPDVKRASTDATILTQAIDSSETQKTRMRSRVKFAVIFFMQPFQQAEVGTCSVSIASMR